VKEALGISKKLKQSFDSVKQSGGFFSGLLGKHLARKKTHNLDSNLSNATATDKANFYFGS